MSAPYGAPQQAPQQSASPGQPSGGTDITSLLPLVAAGLGLVGYLLGFLDASMHTGSFTLIDFSLITAAALAGLRRLPKSPNTLYAAAPLSVYATLGLLQSLVASGVTLVTILLLLVALLQSGAVVWALLNETGVASPPGSKSAEFAKSGPLPKPGQSGPYGQPQPAPWNPQPQPVQPGGWNPASGPQGQPYPPQPAPAPQGQQPAGWSPASGGFAAPGQQPVQQQTQQTQQAQQAQQGQQQPTQQGQQGQQSNPDPSGGPLGTQQMPHPGSSSS